MTQALLIDEAWAQIPPAVVKAHGYIGVIGYVSRDASKCLDRTRAQQYLDDGLGVRYIFEDIAQRALGGYNAGYADGQFCFSYLRAVGLPQGKPVGFAVDFAPTAAQMPAVLEYGRGFRAGLAGYYEAYAYGDADVVDAMTAAGVPDDWQTCAWSHDVVDGKATLYQRLRPTTGMTGSFDEDVALGDVAALGLWTLAPAPAPAPTPAAPERKYAMLAFAAGLDVSLLSLVFQRRSGAATTDLAEATDAIKRGDTVVVIGGPAATALGQNAQAIAGAPHIVGSTTYLVGATADDSLAMAVAALK